MAARRFRCECGQKVRIAWFDDYGFARLHRNKAARRAHALIMLKKAES